MKRNKGITLIALIITIIITLILIGVGVDYIFDTEIFEETNRAVDETNNRTSQEQERVDDLMSELNSLSD